MRLLIQKRESIHSYLLRSLACHGYLIGTASFSGIVNTSGLVRALPRLDESRSVAFADLDDETIEKLVLEHSPVSKAPKDYLLYLKEYILFGDTFNNLEVELTNVGLLPTGQTKIRYCKFCFLDQMRSFGFTWFLLDWLFDIECYHHHILLSHVHTARTECCGMQLSFHQNFYSVLNGSCRGCNQNRWSFAQPIKIQGVHYNYLDTYQDEIHRKIPLGY